MAYADRALGPLLDAARRGSRPTLVIVTADHGESLGEHGEMTHGVFAYEPTLRIPLLLAQVGPSATPAAEPKGSGRPAHHVDLLPTVLDALALPASADLPGVSILPNDENASPPEPSTAYFEAMSPSLNRGWAPLAGIIVGREKYIDVPLPEIYDLARDPDEAVNLAVDPERRRPLEARLEALNPTPPGARATVSSAAADRLRSLGYVVGATPSKAAYTADNNPKRLIRVDQMLHEGIDLYQRGRPEEAAALYRRVLAERPDMPIVYRHLAFIDWMLGRADAAVSTLRGALAGGLANAELQAQLGIYLAESGRATEALRLLEPMATTDEPPADVDLLTALGIAYARAGATPRALETFQALVRLDPDDALGFENLGAVHLELDDLQAARAAFTRALTLAPSSSRAHSGLGVVSLRQGDREEAIGNWTRAVSLDPQNYDALYNLATELANAGRLAATQPYLERFVQTAPPALYATDIQRLSRLLAAR